MDKLKRYAMFNCRMIVHEDGPYLLKIDWDDKLIADEKEFKRLHQIIKDMDSTLFNTTSTIDKLQKQIRELKKCIPRG